MPTIRDRFDTASIEHALGYIRTKASERLVEKGDGIIVSAHETLGIVTEEYHELVEAVRDHHGIEDELLDIAVACLLGIACRDQQDW